MYAAPQGCHVALDKSADCNKFTSAYWIILSMSNIIVTQTENSVPISAFSRFASYYGLLPAPLRDAKNCSNVVSMQEQSYIHMGNWMCF
jgi:hypothetical protein